MTVEELAVAPLPAQGLCPLFGLLRIGHTSVAAMAFQRLGLSPDGSTVVFEISDDFSITGHRLVPAEREGMFLMRADGSGVRRLGPASREATFRVAPDPTAPGGLNGWTGGGYFGFSPNGRLITFTDRGPGPNGEEAIQIFVMDVASGTRRQLTSLPPLAPISPFYPVVFPSFFLDNETIQFSTYATTDVSAYTVAVETRELRPRVPITVPGSVFVPSFSITGPAGSVFGAGFFGRPPVNQLAHLESVVNELFIASGTNLLQLTCFNRSDTGWSGSLLTPDRQRVLFTASADPFGRNPYENCQIFSIDALGADLRELTDFNEGTHSVGGCVYPFPPGCFTAFIGPDPATDSVALYSSCNPLRTNPYGGQFFAIHFDGTGLRQLSTFKGMVTEADGTVTVELPGPVGYPQP